MFDDLRAAFQQAVENFNRELDGALASSGHGPRLQPMADELSAAEAELRDVERRLDEARRDQKAADDELETVQRRERLARDAGDLETASIARDFEQKLLRRTRVLATKVQALHDEADYLRSEVLEMRARFDEARATLAERSPADAQVAGSPGSHSADFRVDPHERPEPIDIDVDARLEELKRRMGRSD